ncbi:lipid-binding SYLF domain-containing protein [Yunchengibacter salinarum]|uniref:lipid-binding SYLF domain-containing protein n=1 Tax=Yunchengibacter salinarum TaxID=3133399 RepID=UPI0035B631C0
MADRVHHRAGRRIVAGLLMALALTAGPALAKSDAENRAGIMDMHDKTLTDLYSEEPDARNKLEGAVGYAVFSNVGVNVIFFSAGGGKGVAIDNRSGEKTFMKMASAGVGLGIGVKDFRAVFIFYSDDAFTGFVEDGWDFSGQADAAAQSDTKGAEASDSKSVLSDVEVYQFTKSGVALQATLQGTKYWQNDNLND